MDKTIGIIGDRPASISGALWLKYLGFFPIIFEKKTTTWRLTIAN